MKWLFPAVLVAAAAAVAGCSGADGAGAVEQVAHSTAAAAAAPAGARGPAPAGVAPGNAAEPRTPGADADCATATPPPLDAVMGRYVVRSAEKYRGGLTTAEQAQARVGSDVALAAGSFSIDGRQSDQPVYAIACHDVSRAEGEVPTGRQRLLGPFHGFGTDRAVVWELTVEAADTGDLLAAFEVLPHGAGMELWRLHDGWFYRLEREAGQGAP